MSKIIRYGINPLLHKDGLPSYPHVVVVTYPKGYVDSPKGLSVSGRPFLFWKNHEKKI